LSDQPTRLIKDKAIAESKRKAVINLLAVIQRNIQNLHRERYLALAQIHLAQVGFSHRHQGRATHQGDRG
jgi:hypothetical protein